MKLALPKTLPKIDRHVVLTAAAAGAVAAVAAVALDRWLRKKPAAPPPPPPPSASKGDDPPRVLSAAYDVRVGDRVVADVAHKDVRVGDVGRVVGLVAGRDAEAGRARVAFDGGTFNYMPGQQCHRVPLAGDFAIGDAVAMRSTNNRGVVAGLSVDDSKLLVDVDGGRVAAGVDELDHAPLVGAFLTKGDRVTACAPFERVAVGDRGVVAGPCSSLGLDSFQSRVLVDFGAKGRYNYTRAQLAFENLIGDYAKEDKVVATAAIGAHVRPGDHGVVVGVARAAGDVRVDFGDTRVVDAAARALAHAPLVQGHAIKKGDRIVAKVAYEDTRVGDVGIVLGPCDREMQARDQRVCVLWERTKAKNNWQPGRHIDLEATYRDDSAQ